MAKLTPRERENAVNEVRILASIQYSCCNLSHPNIVGYKEAFFEDATRSLCIVMEFADGGDLLRKVNVHSKNGTHFSESEIWHMFIQMVAGLKVLHGMKVLHRDIKVEFIRF